MAVLLALGVGGAVVGIAVYDDYSDYSRYSDWGEYPESAVERKRRRIESVRQETESAARDLSGFKTATVNPQLTDYTLRQAPAMTVSESAMDSNAIKAIDEKIQTETSTAVQTDEQKLAEIDSLLARIREIEEEENGYES